MIILRLYIAEDKALTTEFTMLWLSQQKTQFIGFRVNKMLRNKLGETLLNYRKKTGMTIRQFAEHSGISTSLISQLERGNANPSLSVLELIAKALNVPLFTLFINDIDPNTLISRKKDRKKVYRENREHTVYDVLTPDFMKANIEMLMMDLRPHAQTTKGYFVHQEKEELAVVMSGETCVVLDGHEHVLDEGDVVRIPPRVKHKFLNKSDHTIHILFVLTPSLI